MRDWPTPRSNYAANERKKQNMSNINAVKVRLKISQFGNSREDKPMTAEAVQKHNLGKKAVKVTKNKLHPETLEGVRKAAAEIRQQHGRLTLHWDDGERLLTLSAKPAYDATMAGLRAEFEKEVNDFMAAYPAAVESARTNLHKETWLATDYPGAVLDYNGRVIVDARGAEQVRESFQMEIHVEPIPQGSHFLGTLTGAALEAAQASMEARNRQRIDEAVADTWRRLIEPLKHMADKLASPDAVFRDTLVENVSDIVALIPALNLTGSSQLSSAAAEVQTILAGVSANALRENPIVRKATAEAAAAVLERFGAMGQRKFAVATDAAAA